MNEWINIEKGLPNHDETVLVFDEIANFTTLGKEQFCDECNNMKNHYKSRFDK